MINDERACEDDAERARLRIASHGITAALGFVAGVGVTLAMVWPW